MDTIAIVGSGESALVLLRRAIDANLEVISVSVGPEALRLALRKQLPVATRAGLDGSIRFTDDLAEVAECSFVIDCTAGAVPAARAQAMRALEDRMTGGAILASAAATEDLEALAVLLARPAQFLGMRPAYGLARIEIEATAETALGVVDTAERLARMLSVAGASSSGERATTGEVPAVESASSVPG